MLRNALSQLFDQAHAAKHTYFSPKLDLKTHCTSGVKEIQEGRAEGESSRIIYCNQSKFPSGLIGSQNPRDERVNLVCLHR